MAALHIPPDRLADLIAQCRAALPYEACGFLAGQDRVVLQVLPVVNERASTTAFRTEPASTFAAFRAMREAGTELLAVYHSHPTSEPIPSPRDLAENTYGTVAWVIVGLSHIEPVVRAWQLGVSGYHELELILMAHEQHTTNRVP